MVENMNIEKSECVKATARGLKLKMNSIEENMELVKQIITDATKVKGGNKHIQDRLSSLEEELCELGSTVKQDTRKLLKTLKAVRGMIGSGLEWYTLMNVELDERPLVQRSKNRITHDLDVFYPSVQRSKKRCTRVDG